MIFGLDFKFVLIVLAVAVVLIVVLGGGKNKSRAGLRGDRRCEGCGTDHPAFAQFCRRCGRKLP